MIRFRFSRQTMPLIFFAYFFSFLFVFRLLYCFEILFSSFISLYAFFFF